MKELKKTQCRKVLKIASRIYPYKVYVRSEAHMFCEGCRAPESPCILYGGPCILYGELTRELTNGVGTVELI